MFTSFIDQELNILRIGSGNSKISPDEKDGGNTAKKDGDADEKYGDADDAVGDDD